ncbi:MAG: type II secretion system protein GspG [Kiritimatiellae bacterium]|jgi:prepilin-type N-terminal cleavage/methylation domain-containing protein|nr:type II secretion system protein GspG [Kiritimatiellia bacterium]
MKRDITYNRRGVTLLEISFVTAIAAVLMAMILGLAHHMTAVSNIRRAQSDLGAWHLAMDNWYEIFGAYPGEVTEEGVMTEFLLSHDDEYLELSKVYYECRTEFYINGYRTNQLFTSCCTLPTSIYDPWGEPYRYFRDDNKQAYKLFSCGPDTESGNVNFKGQDNPDSTTLDDIFFEN